ncbi:MAG: serine protease [Nitrospirae bacterium CG_4_10_14_0_8_um_filter_41_23]|nr:nodulation protein NfeD [Nitrospirota bacterium]PIV42402.1 MAG: serine protease [Nitrospirae bacterium CG02_land_8_20_14_3_00_41_53]PIW88308.1 MAG: serine protease [Nitrospirae bacterium CG_4_8_14_3_um_filter_41_47]PIY86121.1 MAG: serine protease [Nitrospirae bacterium CG_4_10_14_0_8_um_filter_41_23]PJA81130.1 MAG: serine protease [Nitrospirae bacterium CG_4_9_14_3_um_filter_41_27]
MFIKTIFLIFLILFSFSAFSENNPPSPPFSKGGQGGFAEEIRKEVIVITVDGVINPVSAEYIGKSIKKANEKKAEALIIELDTPGGLDTSMRNIVKDIIGSEVPVVVYVSPSGSRAASAGVFITLAAHIAAMAPGTNIGAAHPVGIGEKMDKVMAEKATNDAAAYIKSLAERNGRNAKWAEDAVRKSISATEKEALKEKVIDLVSKDLNSLLSDIDSRKVRTITGQKILMTAKANVTREEIGIRHKILNLISDPNIAYILMLLGFYGLFFELTNPGALFPGVIGGICLILAFYAFQTLPVNYAGLLLIILAIILFVLEVKIVSHGVLTIGGIIAMIIGSLMLFESPAPFMKLSLYIILPAVIITALFFTVTFGLAFKAYKRKPVTGSEGLIGAKGIADTDITKDGGMVLLHGERWAAYSDEPIGKGENIIVETVSGLKVKVKRYQ